MSVPDITDKTFDKEVLEHDKPVIVMFRANWCGPCKMIRPILNELAEEFKDEVKFVKVDIDEETKSSMKYGIRGIPTVMLFINGEYITAKVGACAKSQYVAFIHSNVEGIK